MLRRSAIGAGVLLPFITACADLGPGPGTARVRTVVDVAAAGGSTSNATILATISLTATGPDGRPRSQSRAIPAGVQAVPLTVTVPTGEVRFDAAIVSNKNVDLYRGSQTVQVDGDGFSVSIPMSPVNAVMTVTPDSIVADPSDGGSFVVSNRGSQPLSWQVSAISPPQDSCGTRLPCIRLFPPAGTVQPGSSQTVVVLRGSTLAQTYDLTFDADVGSTVVSARMTVAGVIIARTILAGTTTPVSNVLVGLFICGTQSQAGPDASCAQPLLADTLRTEANGRATFAGLSPGFYATVPVPTSVDLRTSTPSFWVDLVATDTQVEHTFLLR